MDNEMTHQSDERYFWGFAASDERLVAELQGGVITAGDECRHVKGFSRQRSAAADESFTLPAAAFPRMGSDARQRGSLRPVEFSQLRHFGQEADDGFGADADDLLESLGFGLQGGILLQQGLDLLLEFLQVAPQLAKKRGVLLAQGRQRQVAGLLDHVLGHGLELQAMARQLAQDGGVLGQRGLRARGGLPAKLGQQCRVDAIGLGAQSAGFGEVAHARGFDNGHWDAGLVEGGHDGLLITASGFTDNPQRLGKGF